MLGFPKSYHLPGYELKFLPEPNSFFEKALVIFRESKTNLLSQRLL
jgi:hypothetical protein